jgi:glycosyltransferase involved in cell wall biosynthesis
VTDAASNLHPPIPHGVPGELHRFHETAGDYLVYSGPIAYESGIEDAVRLAERSDLDLKIVSDISMGDRGYFTDVFVPMLHANRRVQWTGELDDRARNAMLGGARALLAPNDRSGAFEMQVIEALACATPVVAWVDTAAASISEDGVSGFVVRNSEEALAAVTRIATLERHACRRLFEEQFDMRLIAAQYARLYARLLHANDASIVTVASCRRASAPPRS